MVTSTPSDSHELLGATAAQRVGSRELARRRTRAKAARRARKLNR